MTKDEALKMALEALKANDLLINGTEKAGGLAWCIDGYYSDCFDIDPINEQTERAIAAIKEALAQEQEPVAWIERDIQSDDFDPDSVTCEKPTIAADGWEWIPLYTTPPQPEQEPINIERHEANVEKFLGAPQPKEWESVDGYFLPISALNEPMQIGIEKLIAHAKQARWTNAIVRKDSVETSYEADWIKSLVKHITPPQRTWVGLTAGEILDTLISVDEKTVRLPAMLGQFACAIEAKLKEKNT